MNEDIEINKNACLPNTYNNAAPMSLLITKAREEFMRIQLEVFNG
jgi:hypothetical protein